MTAIDTPARSHQAAAHHHLSRREEALELALEEHEIGQMRRSDAIARAIETRHAKRIGAEALDVAFALSHK